MREGDTEGRKKDGKKLDLLRAAAAAVAAAVVAVAVDEDEVVAEAGDVDRNPGKSFTCWCKCAFAELTFVLMLFEKLLYKIWKIMQLNVIFYNRWKMQLQQLFYFFLKKLAVIQAIRTLFKMNLKNVNF